MKQPAPIDIAPAGALIASLDAVGIRLTLIPDDGDYDVYLIVTPSEGTLYIGSATSAGKRRRTRDEAGWVDAHALDRGSIGLARLGARHGSKHRRYRLEGIDLEALRALATTKVVDGVLANRLENFDSNYPTHRDRVRLVERALVRLVIQSGYLIGNSQYASQWEDHWHTLADEIAYLAMWSSRDRSYDLTRGFPLVRTPSVGGDGHATMEAPPA